MYLFFLQFYCSLPDEPLMDVFIEILNMYKTVSQLLSERSVFIAVTVLIFLNLAPDICPAYNTN